MPDGSSLKTAFYDSGMDISYLSTFWSNDVPSNKDISVLYDWRNSRLVFEGSGLAAKKIVLESL